MHKGSLNRLRQEIGQAKRRNDSVERSCSLFLSDLMLIRLEQGLSQAQLAKRSGLKQSAIARIESGRVNPTLVTVIKLARALNKRLVLE